METIINDQIAELIVKECRGFAISRTAGTRHNASDMESYLVEKVWLVVSENPSYQNIKGIRQIIKSRGYNFFNKEGKTNITPFSSFEKDSFDKSARMFENTLTDNKQESIEDTYINSLNLTELLESLPLRQRLVVELSCGILDSLNSEQLEIAHQILDSKSKCSCGTSNCNCLYEVYLTIKDIAQILGCSPRTVDYDLKRVQGIQ